MIKACIFDLDGTVADTLTTIAYFVNGALKKFGFPAIETEKYKKEKEAKSVPITFHADRQLDYDKQCCRRTDTCVYGSRSFSGDSGA